MQKLVLTKLIPLCNKHIKAVLINADNNLFFLN